MPTKVDMRARRGARVRPTAGGLEQLTAAHVDIRVAMRALSELLDSGVSGSKAAAVERKLASFLSGPLFLHEEAESSLLVAMIQSSAAPEADLLAHATHKAHAALDVQRVDVLQGLVEASVTGGRISSELAARASHLVSNLERHLVLEEALLYPAAREFLSPKDDQRLGMQMAALARLSTATSRA